MSYPIPVNPDDVRTLGTADDALILAVITQSKRTADDWVRFSAEALADLTGLTADAAGLSLERLVRSGHLERRIHQL